GHHAFKGGVQGTATWLMERFETGVTNAGFNTPCLTPTGDPELDTSLRDPGSCAASGLTANPAFLVGLLPHDLTRAGKLFSFNGRTRITQWTGYVQDAIAFGDWTGTIGTRLDIYHGLSRGTAVQPRLGLTYQSTRTKTVGRAAYGRILLTPYNENLVLASS